MGTQDLYIKHGAYGIGYPQVNNLVSSNNPSSPNPNHWFVTRPGKHELVSPTHLGVELNTAVQRLQRHANLSCSPTIVTCLL